jgi:hypothetical protein
VYNGNGVQSTVTLLCLATNQGRRQPPQGSPQALASGEERMRSEVDPHRRFLLALWVPCLWRLRRSCWPRVFKTSARGRRKTVPRRILGCFCCDDGDTSGSKNETRLVAAGPPGWVTAGVAVEPGPGSLLQRCGLPGMAPAAVHTLRQLTAMISSCCST